MGASGSASDDWDSDGGSASASGCEGTCGLGLALPEVELQELQTEGTSAADTPSVFWSHDIIVIEQ